MFGLQNKVFVITINKIKNIADEKLRGSLKGELLPSRPPPVVSLNKPPISKLVFQMPHTAHRGTIGSTDATYIWHT
jgi:hypothetical protein